MRCLLYARDDTIYTVCIYHILYTLRIYTYSYRVCSTQRAHMGCIYFFIYLPSIRNEVKQCLARAAKQKDVFAILTKLTIFSHSHIRAFTDAEETNHHNHYYHIYQFAVLLDTAAGERWGRWRFACQQLSPLNIKYWTKVFFHLFSTVWTMLSYSTILC